MNRNINISGIPYRTTQSTINRAVLCDPDEQVWGISFSDLPRLFEGDNGSVYLTTRRVIKRNAEYVTSCDKPRSRNRDENTLQRLMIDPTNSEIILNSYNAIHVNIDVHIAEKLAGYEGERFEQYIVNGDADGGDADGAKWKLYLFPDGQEMPFSFFDNVQPVSHFYDFKYFGFVRYIGTDTAHPKQKFSYLQLTKDDVDVLDRIRTKILDFCNTKFSIFATPNSD